MDTSTQSEEEFYAEWNKIFEVLKPPPPERVWFVHRGYKIEVGDFAWAAPLDPKDKEGMVHLIGYNENHSSIWHADFELVEVRYIGPKPIEFPKGKNPYAVKRPALSAVLLIDRIKWFAVRQFWGKRKRILRGKLNF